MNETKQFYEDYALKEIPKKVKSIEELRYKMIMHGLPFPPQKILDIGCGNGDLICALAEKGYDCIGLDLSENRLEKFKNRPEKSGVLSLQGDAAHIPIRDSSVDIVICSELLEHIKEYEDILKETNRVLKSQGKIIVSVPYEERLNEVSCSASGEKVMRYGHVHIFDKDKLLSSMDRCGFNIEYNYVGPSIISRIIYRRLKIGLSLVFFIDRVITKISKRLAYNVWLIVAGEKKAN